MMLAVGLVYCQASVAQRFTDNLDRGLVAVPTGSTSGSTSNLVSWRRLAEEYYNVTYNLYKNGTRVVSNWCRKPNSVIRNLSDFRHLCTITNR